MVNIQQVTFSYNRKSALLSNLSLELGKGRIHGLLGKNGEGKSTLLKLMAGLVFAKKGQITTLGFNPQERQPEMLCDIYFLPEELPQLNMSIANFEKIYSPFYPKFDSKQFDTYLREFDISNKSDVLTKLSHGQKKKIFIAFGLATNTSLLLMDEPTNGLDIPSKGQFRRMVASSVDENRCLVISTHQVHDLDSLIDNILIMEQHQIVFNQPIELITKKLQFKMAERHETSEEVIYSEETLRGKSLVCVNKTGEESKLDIELLFNAITTDKNNKLVQLF